MTNSAPVGSVEEFDKNWKERSEAKYNHWIKGAPQNQIQLAFRNHWELFSKMLKGRPQATCLEVGCGRGSLSSYFADNGIQCTLLDLSQSVLDTAKDIYRTNGHQASFIRGDAMALPFENNSFDVVTSIGLLEHFEDIKTVLHEQHRILKPNGTCFAYIVPERPDNIQKYFNWCNRILKGLAGIFSSQTKEASQKTDIFRSDFDSTDYLNAIKDLKITNVETFGMYPLPMVSHSPEFPFSLLPPPVEFVLTRIFMLALFVRKQIFGNSLPYNNPWTCDEKTGQAFLVTFQKVE